MKILRILGFALGTGICCLLILWWSKDRCSHIYFRLPNDYRGFIHIVADDSAPLFGDAQANRCTYTVPSDGVLRVESCAPLENWHSTRASYLDGRRISVGSEAAEEEIALRYLYGDGDGGMWILVGTKAEEDYAWKHNPYITAGPMPVSKDASSSQE